METKHTPGPWVLQKDYPTNVITAPNARYVPSVATVDIGPGDSEEVLANGHLIAAAPELLEALSNLELSANSLQYCFDRRPENFGVALTQLTADAQRARAVIAKAKGAA